MVMFNELPVMVNDLVDSIEQSGFKPNCILAINRGGLVPGVMLSHFYDCPLVSINIECLSSCDIAELTDIDSNVLVIDDVSCTGKSLSIVRKAFDDFFGKELESYKHDFFTNQIKFATLTLVRGCPFNVDFFVEEISSHEAIDFEWEKWW